MVDRVRFFLLNAVVNLVETPDPADEFLGKPMLMIILDQDDERPSPGMLLRNIGAPSQVEVVRHEMAVHVGRPGIEFADIQVQGFRFSKSNVGKADSRAPCPASVLSSSIHLLTGKRQSLSSFKDSSDIHRQKLHTRLEKDIHPIVCRNLFDKTEAGTQNAG